MFVVVWLLLQLLSSIMCQALDRVEWSANVDQALNTPVKCPEEQIRTKDNNHPIVLTLMNNKRDSLLQVSDRNNGLRNVMSSAVWETTFQIATLSFCFSEPSENSSFADSSTETRLNVPQGTILSLHCENPTVLLIPLLSCAVALTPPADGNSMRK